MKRPAFAYVKSKGTHQLYGNASDQPHCFSYTDSTIPLLSASKTSSLVVQFCGCTARFVLDAPVTEQTGFKSVFFCVLSFHFFAPKLFACFAVHSRHFNKYTFM